MCMNVLFSYAFDTILFLWNEWEDDVMRDVFFQNEMKHRSNHVGLGAKKIRGV